MQSLDKEKQREAISIAITTIYEGPVKEDVRITFIDVMKGMLNVILYPLTSTQLGVFSNFLDLKKLDVHKPLTIVRGSSRRGFWIFSFKNILKMLPKLTKQYEEDVTQLQILIH